MLSENDVIATIPVSDLPRSRKFYEEKLGLVVDTLMGDYCVLYNTGDTRVFVYQSDDPFTPGSVVATWAVEDLLETLVAELQDKGIVFQTFARKEFVAEGVIQYADGFKCAVFKDPDGHLLSLFQPNF
jgi:catechol 2,3-dioxygenase-like lactoylglutathione lyase family enzyme